jgi:hypothetical protein
VQADLQSSGPGLSAARERRCTDRAMTMLDVAPDPDSA